jgi:hypothetical protein
MIYSRSAIPRFIDISQVFIVFLHADEHNETNVFFLVILFPPHIYKSRNTGGSISFLTETNTPFSITFIAISSPKLGNEFTTCFDHLLVFY